ncbi:hypothetical protein ACTMS2_20105 [Micromonospora sp. SD12]|uniref:hypothetical protein n=1 Tax=Micromonospora sp. SD12 TaxID=3452216 RepID=UPI003F8A11AE
MTDTPFNIATIVLSVLALVVATLAARYGRAALFPGKRELRIYWIPPTPLVASSGTKPVSMLFEIENRVLQNPYLTHIELHVGGRHDIKSSDFDQNKPITLNFDTTATLVTSSSELASAISSEGAHVNINPSLLRRGTQLSFDVVTESAPATITSSDHLIDTQVTITRQPTIAQAHKKLLREWRNLTLGSTAVALLALAMNAVTLREWNKSTDRWLEITNNWHKLAEICGL